MNDSKTTAQPDRAVEVGHGVLFIGLAKASFMVFGALQKFLLARVVNVAEFGAFSLVNNATSILNNTIVQGTIQYVSRFTVEDDARAGAVQRAGLRLQAFFGLGVALAFFLVAPLVARFVNAPEHTSLFRLAAAVPAIYAFYSVFVGTANGQRRFKVQASFDIGFSISKTILLLVGAVVGRMAGHSVAGALLGFIAAALLILLISGQKMWLAKGNAQFSARQLFVFMVGTMAYTLLINLALIYDSLLLRRFAGAALAGQSADMMMGAYEAVRSMALLPYQALLVVTFVISPLVSRSTFAEDREATAAYVRQTLRFALIFGAAMAVVLGARPEALLRILYPAAYGVGASAMPILAAGVVALALLSIAGSIVTAAGRPYVAMTLVALTLATGTGLAFTLVPRAAPGPHMLFAAAFSTAVGMLVGFVVALVYMRRRFGAGLPLASALRVVLAVALAVLVARVLPGTGKIAGLAAMALAGIVYVGTLLLAREFGPSDREKFLKIIRRKRG